MVTFKDRPVGRAEGDDSSFGRSSTVYRGSFSKRTAQLSGDLERSIAAIRMESIKKTCSIAVIV